MSRLFISYRRDDTLDITARIFGAMDPRFGKERIFMDVDSIPLGVDFRQVLRDAINASSVVLVIIGRQWLTLTDERSARRLDDPNDFVRIEVEAALARGVPVVPVLTQGAAMPRESDLPPSIAALAFRNGMDVRSDQHFNGDVDQLIRRLAPLLDAAPTPQLAPAPVAPFPTPRYPLPDMPARLASLGFRGQNRDGVPFILPPLVTIPAGPFRLGSDKRRDKDARDDELQRLTVDLPAFQIARFPVPVAEYARFVDGATRNEPQSSYSSLTWGDQLKRPDHPVVNVSWYDAYDYAAWLAQRTGQPWRLPTEAEWEKAARLDPRDPLGAGSERIYPWGDAFDSARCNSWESGLRATSPVGWYNGATENQRAGRKSGSSPCEVEEMAGNVWEWTASLRAAEYTLPSQATQRDSTGRRALRGGSWDDGPASARTACRDHGDPGFASDFVGFRLALAVPGSPS